jgi:hypothetical protein
MIMKANEVLTINHTKKNKQVRLFVCDEKYSTNGTMGKPIGC